MNGTEATGISELWHYAINSERKGPVSEATLGKLLVTGEISAETYVWQPGMDNWMHLADVPELDGLVAGVGANRSDERFEEEDTSFSSRVEIASSHEVLASDVAPEQFGGVGTDTIVESVDDFLLATNFAAGSPQDDATQMVAAVVDDPEPAAIAEVIAEEPEEATLIANVYDEIADDPGAVTQATAAVEHFGEFQEAATIDEPVEELFGASAAVATAAPAATDDVFGASAAIDDSDPFADADGAEPDGVHGRRQSSVLFSLDELGRDSGDAAGAPSGGDPFVTDSSGLIDIKAIASKDDGGDGVDPFAAGAGLVIPAKTGVGGMSMPLVERKKSKLPWLLAGLVLIGAGVAAFFAFSGPSEAELAEKARVEKAAQVAADAERDRIAKAEQDAAVEKARQETESKLQIQLAEEKAKAAAAAAKVEVAQAQAEAAKAKADAAKKVAAATAIPTGTLGGTIVGSSTGGVVYNGATAGAVPYNGTVNSGGTGSTYTGSTTTYNSGSTTTTTKPRKRRRRTTTSTASKSTASSSTTTSRPTTTSKSSSGNTSGNTKRVDNILSSLSGSKSSGGGSTGSSGANLPKKLSASAVRTAVKRSRSKFAKCGGGGSTSVNTQFVIKSSGRVSSARVTSGTSDAKVKSCVVRALKATKFGSFSDSQMTVNYPIRLK